MKQKNNHIDDIAAIRSMMERSTKFLSLTGWSGIMAGIYALLGAWIAYGFFNFNPDSIEVSHSDKSALNLPTVILTAVVVLILTLGTAIILSKKKAAKKGETVWNGASRRLIVNLTVPLAAGGIFIIILTAKGYLGLIAPLTLLFYGLTLFNISKFTYEDVKILGVIQIILGLAGSYFPEYGLILWAAGFGIVHIIYGIYLHLRYDR